MSRLKVVHLAKFYPPATGGMERVVADLCEGTADFWDVSVIAAHTRAHSTNELAGEVAVKRLATLATLSSVPLCPAMPPAIWRSRADCVVLHEPNPVAGASLFCHVPAPNFVIWHHSDLVRPWWASGTYGHLQKTLYRRAAAVIVSSPALAESSPLVRQARRVEVVPFGVSLERYRRQDTNQRALVDRMRSTSPGPQVLFVGRLVYYKGLDLLIRAMTACPGRLLLVGRGPLEPALRAQVSALGLDDRVTFLGPVPDNELPTYYRAADVFVLPSIARTEAFGVVQVEAMAAGLPVISTRLQTGVPWVNRHEETGIVVPPGDSQALAEAINRLLADPALRARFGRNGALRAQREFSRPLMIDRFRAVVESAVGVQTTSPLTAPAVARTA